MKKSLQIFLVIGMSLLAYKLTSDYLTNHIIQHSVPHTHLTLVTHDGYTNKQVFKDLIVKSVSPMDTNRNAKHYSQNRDVKDFLFHQNPVFMVWIMLVSIMLAVAAGSCIGFIAIIAQVYRKLSGTLTSLLIAIACAGLIVYGLAFANTRVHGYYYPVDIVMDFKILLSNPAVFKTIEQVTLSLSIPALTLIFLCGLLGGKFNTHTVTSEKDYRGEAAKFNQLANALLTALQVLSITVVFSVLTSTTLGRSINATLKIEGFDLYPPEISFVYGLLFSVFIGIIYIPIHLFLQREYNNLKESASDLAFEDKTIRQSFLDEMFSNKLFESGALDNLKIIFTVMAPLISGIVPGLIEGFK